MKISTNLLKKNSKSFYFASLFLPLNNFKNCSILYSFCRQIDDIADKNTKNKKKKLNFILNMISSKENFSLKKFPNLKYLITNKLIEKQCLIELISGVILDTKIKVHISNEKQLINYSYLVAGTVGIMMAKLLGNNNSYANKYAVDLGIAMQLTNIMRDILEDAAMNRIYFPKSWGYLTPADVIAKNKNTEKKLKKITSKFFKFSEVYYISALKGIAFLPFRSKLSILLALNIYRKIGKKIISNDFSNLKKREYVTFYEKIIIFIQTLFIFVFNYNLHIKKYNHDSNLHKEIYKKSYLMKNIYE